ncbi:hypothetical protein BURKHO8Y_30174 [Burkholderia sp. 8Y]|nr:hypothetical protein BURKHO8Y_30174 [Burkholderia sp. 8Y]
MKSPGSSRAGLQVQAHGERLLRLGVAQESGTLSSDRCLAAFALRAREDYTHIGAFVTSFESFC